MSFQSIKSYGPEAGLSAVFRQWRANSHCRYLHGYALSFTFVFESSTLDSRNWVVDFGAMKSLKERLVMAFDHKLIVAVDDPKKLHLLSLANMGLAEITIMPDVGCEAFAQYAYVMARDWLNLEYLPSLAADGIDPPEDLECISVEVREHPSNGAKYLAD